MNEVDRHDLDALKELMTAKFEGVENTLEGMKEALHVAASERIKDADLRKEKDKELNDVRQRFVDRVTFEQYRESTERALDTALASAAARIKPLEDFKSKALGFGALLALLSGVGGAVVSKVVGG